MAMTKILLVDDVALFLELERSFFEGLDYQILTARSGEEALEVIEEEEPSLVLLDLFMVGIDGDEVCRRLRADERWKKLPVIMVTAAGKEEQIKQCVEAGCDDYITKPINKNALLEKVHRLLGKVRSRTAPRQPVSLNVRLQSGERSIEACAQDISRNGIYVKSSHLLEAGASVELCLSLPDGKELPVMGKVKRVQEGANEGMGIYFVHPDQQGLDTLQALLTAAPVSAASATSDSVQTRQEKEHAELQAENQRLLARIEELEAENQDFAEQLIEIEQVNNNLTNLYIASTKLHSELNRKRVVDIIQEVVINFVGAEKFALLLYADERKALTFETGEGFAEGEFPVLKVTGGLWQDVVEKAESYYQDGDVTDGSDDPQSPVAAIPLRIQGRSMGVLAIYRLFVQKDAFAPVDYQLFSMMAEHAATALFSSSLYEASERKRETYKGFMDLLLK